MTLSAITSISTYIIANITSVYYAQGQSEVSPASGVRACTDSKVISAEEYEFNEKIGFSKLDAGVVYIRFRYSNKN